ncbi:MAG: hypothetical protein U0353_13665 [Sandaracinus sp.]
MSRNAQSLDDLARAAIRVRHARLDAARLEAELDAILNAARTQGVSHRALARELLLAWGVPLAERELRRFTDALRKRVERTRCPADRGHAPRRSRPSSSWFPFEQEVPMNERLVKRTTVTTTEVFTDAAACEPCSPRTTLLGGASAGEAANDTPAANSPHLAAVHCEDGATCPITFHDVGGDDE